MAKIRTALSVLGSAKDAKRFAAQFDDPDRTLAAETHFPPDEVRPAVTEACTILLRVTDAAEHDGEIFAVVHVTASRDGIAIFVFNPNIVIEAGATLRELVSEAGYPVAVAIVEEFLGTRIDHVAELKNDALAEVINAIGPLATYSRTAFTSDGADFIEGTNHLDGTTSQVFTAAAPVDDAGQTRTRNQRALVRALVNTIDVRKLAKDNEQFVQVIGPLANGTRKDPRLTSSTLVQLANDLRGITRKDIVAVTVPAVSERDEYGIVRISFEADVLEGLRDAIASGNAGEFASQLAKIGY